MKTILYIILAIVGFAIGAYLFAYTPSGELIGAAGDGGDTATASTDLVGHIVSGIFGLLAAYLLIKNMNNSPRNRSDTIIMFSIAILTTIFGRYLGPVALPAFLSLPR